MREEGGDPSGVDEIAGSGKDGEEEEVEEDACLDVSEGNLGAGWERCGEWWDLKVVRGEARVWNRGKIMSGLTAADPTSSNPAPRR